VTTREVYIEVCFLIFYEIPYTNLKMFKKPKKIKNLRRGEVSGVDASDQDEIQEQIEKPIKPQKPTLLSFDDEGELQCCKRLQKFED
jgi:hypothetical protein